MVLVAFPGAVVGWTNSSVHGAAANLDDIGKDSFISAGMWLLTRDGDFEGFEKHKVSALSLAASSAFARRVSSP